MDRFLNVAFAGFPLIILIYMMTKKRSVYNQEGIILKRTVVPMALTDS